MFFTQISQIARISPHRCARGGVCHTDSTDSTDFSASRCLQGLARTYSPCPAGRNLVDLVDYFPSGIVRVRGWFKSCRFLYGIAGCARWMGLSLARGCHTDYTDITDCGGLARVSYSPCPAGRDLVDLVDYFPSEIFSGCGYFNLVDFLQGIAGCARWISLSLRGVSHRKHGIHRNYRIASLAFFLCHTDYTDITDYFASLHSRWALGGIN